MAARRVVWTVLLVWQRHCYPLLTPDSPAKELSHLAAKLEITRFADWLTSQSFNDAAYWLTTAYALLVGEATRTREALYFTPPAVAERVIDCLVHSGASLRTHNWHDPACGGAAFLVPIAQRIARDHEKDGTASIEVLMDIQHRLSGTDLDLTLLGLSQQFLMMAVYDHILSSRYFPKFSLSQADGLLLNDDMRVLADIYVCNPPYRKMGAIEAEKYQSRYGEVIQGQPNLYAFFIYDLLLRARPDSLIGVLTPTSYLSGQYFSKLRKKISSSSHVLHIDMLSDRRAVFMHVEQETSITILKKENSLLPEPTSIALLAKDGNFIDVGMCVLPSVGEPWAIPRSIDDVDLLKGAQLSQHRLIDYGYKPRIGSLVAYRDTRKRYKKAPKQLTGVYPLIWATDFSTDGVFKHGREGNPKRLDRYVKLGNISNTGLISKPAVLLQRLTSNDQVRRLVAAAIPAAWTEEHGPYIAENHVLVLEQIEDKGWDPEMLSKLLNSRAMDQVYRASSGASNVSVYELAHMPLPCPTATLASLREDIPLETVVVQAFMAGLYKQ